MPGDYTLYDSAVQPQGVSLWLWIGLGVVVIGLAVAAFLIIRRRHRLHKRALLGAEALKVSLPKEREVPDGGTRRDPKEVIGVMEAFYTAIHHFHETDRWKAFWHGQPTFSFEIVAHDGEIFFYVVAPAQFRQQIEHQIQSQYPAAVIELSKDHDLFGTQGGESAVSAVSLLKDFIFPIKTYRSMETDPLAGLANSISKLGDGGRAAIQVLVQPTFQRWQSKVESALQNVQQGKSFAASKNGLQQQALSLAKEVGQAALANGPTEQKSNEAQNAAAGNVRLTALQEQQAKLLVEKASKVGFNVQIRCVARMAGAMEAKGEVQTMLSSFAQFNAPEANGFKVSSTDNRNLLVDYILRSFSDQQPTMVLNSEELTSVFHFPNQPLDVPNVHWLGARRLAPPANLPTSGVLIGHSDFRGAEIPVHYDYADRMRHLYMIGKTGVGKTALFENMALQDIRNGHGVCFMDPNGDAVEWLLKHIPRERANDVILFDPSDVARPLALNLLEYDASFPEQKTMVINEMISIFEKLYDLKATGGPMFEQYMRNAMLLVMDDPASGNSLLEIPKVLSDPEYRKLKLSHSTNQVVIDFWTKEAEKAGGEASLANMVPYITSKLTQFTTNDILRPIVAQQKSAFNFRDLMDSRKILLVNLPKGLLGEANAKLLGMIISGKIQIAAFSRQNIPEEQRVPFYLYVDEFQNFTSKTFATILSEARKYQLSLNITNQYVEQLDDETKAAVMGNVGTMLAWRVGASDAEFLLKEFDPLQVDDLVNTERFNFYIRMLIQGTPSTPFNVTAYPPDPNDNGELAEAIRQYSRTTYGRDRETVEAEIRLRGQNMVQPIQET